MTFTADSVDVAPELVDIGVSLVEVTPSSAHPCQNHPGPGRARRPAPLGCAISVAVQCGCSAHAERPLAGFCVGAPPAY